MDVRKLVYGVGINDADYVQTIKEVIGTLPNGRRKEKLVWSCPYYSRWHGILGRCYSKKSRAGKSSYTDCSVCDEWLTFSNFKSWMEQQDWEGKALDKDLFVRGNKVYGPDTCCFISRGLNNFMIEAGSRRGEWPIGVNLTTSGKKFVAKCCDPFIGKPMRLGSFDCPIEAQSAWLDYKLKLAYQFAELESDERIADAIIRRYENYPLQRAS